MRRIILALAAVIVGLVGSTQQADAQRPSGRPEFTLEELAWERSVRATHEADILALPGVVGVGIGERGGEPVIVVLLKEGTRAPNLPSSLSGVKVVAEQERPATFLNGGTVCYNFPTYQGCHDDELGFPVPMGVTTSSEAHYSAGTLGFKACDPISGTLGYVSANHVAAGIPWVSHPFCYNGAPGLRQFHPGLFEVDPLCSLDPVCAANPDPDDFTNGCGSFGTDRKPRVFNGIGRFAGEENGW